MRKVLSTLLLITISISYAFCQQEEVNRFIDNWHKAAAEADAEIFFGSIAENGIYIGTDASERWDKTSFEEFGKPYFDKGKAWDFTPYDRDLHFSADGNTAWFSELLKTWMGVCRGSGILSKQEDGTWKIEQYHLSVTVPNELMDSFLKLVEQK
ncbi:nuclear transport factor 2 family protein [Fulvivirga ligni]|uniref:nuclear transport factor 2 family protein n=1 Tax=Fulvivirga ligni TaxID=2904246 RepID=UPI001F1F4C96|nr:nuclear transport factor 2 family protein [Fulvivirga ligni]UII23745.1 nuclear transport factor 2 family protein [Fulvivirga ligni]